MKHLVTLVALLALALGPALIPVARAEDDAASAEAPPPKKKKKKKTKKDAKKSKKKESAGAKKKKPKKKARRVAKEEEPPPPQPAPDFAPEPSPREPIGEVGRPAQPAVVAPETDPLAPTSSFGGPRPGADVAEIVSADEYLEMVELDPIVDDAIQWDPASGKFLYVMKRGPPYLYLTGVLREGYELSWDDEWVPTKGNRFQIKVQLPLEPRTFRFRVYTPGRRFHTYRYVNFWTKLPLSLREKVKDGGPANERVLGFSPQFRNIGFVQLYSAKNAITHLDLDATRHAKLTFRFFLPTVPSETFDGWKITIRSKTTNSVVGELSRLGPPPLFVDWREIGTNFHSAGRYNYKLTLYHGQDPYEGPASEFDAIEGLSLLDHPYLPAIQLEPREEMGYYFFHNKQNIDYSYLYVGADVPMAIYNRFLLRATALLSLQTDNPQQNLTYLRLAAGFRFLGSGNRGILGDPHIYRIDVYLSNTGITTYKAPNTVSRYNHLALLVEPHLVLWAYHYIVPWVEFGTRPDLSQYRLSVGINYQFYVRPWSVKFGMGVSYDRLFGFNDAPTLEFSILRTMAMFTFFL